MSFQTKQQLDNLPVISMTVGGALADGADAEVVTDDHDTVKILQYLISMPPEDFHRLEMLIMNNADEKTEDIGELTHEIAENLRQALLNITNGEASLPVPPPNYNYIFVNALRTDHPLDATSISTLFDNAPPEFAEAAAQAAQILAQLPAEAQANADIVINRLTNRYRSDMQHHQQTFLKRLIQAFH